MLLLILKIKLLVVFPEKWIYEGLAENCSLGQEAMAKPQACLENQGEECCFTEERAELGGNWKKLGVPYMIASHWLGYCCRLWRVREGGR